MSEDGVVPDLIVDEPHEIGVAIRPLRSPEDLFAMIRSMIEQDNTAPVGFEVDVGWQEDGGDRKGTIKARSSRPSLLKALRDGMEVVRKYDEEAKEAGGLRMTSFAVDLVIERRLMGRRNGYRVQWHLGGTTYEFDPTSLKFYEVDDAE